MDRKRINFKKRLDFLWLCKMAWRDSRKKRSRLLLFISSIIFGIAAIVAIYSFRHNLQKDVDEQAAILLGADLVISGNDTVSARSKDVCARRVAALKPIRRRFGRRKNAIRIMNERENSSIANFPAYGRSGSRFDSEAVSFSMRLLTFSVSGASR